MRVRGSQRGCRHDWWGERFEQRSRLHMVNTMLVHSTHACCNLDLLQAAATGGPLITGTRAHEVVWAWAVCGYIEVSLCVQVKYAHTHHTPHTLTF